VKNPIDKLISILLSLIPFFLMLNVLTPQARAVEVRTFSKNGISLNANGTYGYKHGAMKVSQYFTSNYNDDEQRWEVTPTNNGLSVLRNIAHDKCFNSYQTAIGTTPNLFPCNTNDPDQQVSIEGDTITHAATGLQLNLGDRNDTPVVWKNASGKVSVQGGNEGSAAFWGAVGGAVVTVSVEKIVEKTIDTIIDEINKDTFPEPKDNVYFQIKNSDPSKWDEVATLCDRLKGRLVWQSDLKTCRSD
jgi:hypothetical protein